MADLMRVSQIEEHAGATSLVLLPTESDSVIKKMTVVLELPHDAERPKVDDEFQVDLTSAATEG